MGCGKSVTKLVAVSKGDRSARCHYPEVTPVSGLRIPLRFDAWDIFSLCAFAVWLAVNSDSALLGFNSTLILIDMATLRSGVTPIFLYATYPLSLTLFVYGLWVFRREWPISLLHASSLPALAIVVFELLWHTLGFLTPAFPYPVNRAGWILIVVWLVFGSITLPHWRLSRPLAVALILNTLSWAAWFLSGYTQINTGSSSAYFYNFLLKAETFTVVFALVYPYKAEPTKNKREYSWIKEAMVRLSIIIRS